MDIHLIKPLPKEERFVSLEDSFDTPIKMKEFVLKKTKLSLEEVANEAIEICLSKKKKIIVVVGYFGFVDYLRIKKVIASKNREIKISYSIKRPDIGIPYTKGSYCIQVNRFRFR
ncbi:MAG TPA: hypothetical protein VJZ93_00955 [Candidatus Nanoarchaeia archaeon]|nr:hypothetical protein [Candidatus Nanoarchaeia archaeon]